MEETVAAEEAFFGFLEKESTEQLEKRRSIRKASGSDRFSIKSNLKFLERERLDPLLFSLSLSGSVRSGPVYPGAGRFAPVQFVPVSVRPGLGWSDSVEAAPLDLVPLGSVSLGLAPFIPVRLGPLRLPSAMLGSTLYGFSPLRCSPASFRLGPLGRADSLCREMGSPCMCGESAGRVSGFPQAKGRHFYPKLNK